MFVLGSREEWLEARSGRIGGSEAAAVVGLNPYMTNTDLWEIKTGRRIPEDISDKPYVKYGHDAEPHLRELFALDHPQYQIGYVDNNLFINSRYPWAHASLDGWLTDEDGRFGILEIKTTNILQSMQKEKWNDRIPDNYYLQVLHYMMVMEADFAILKAQLKYDYSSDVFLQVRHYHIERKDVEEDIRFLADKERDFWIKVKNGIRPATILPEI
jgi:putative phage-type endonuclease